MITINDGKAGRRARTHGTLRYSSKRRGATLGSRTVLARVIAPEAPPDVQDARRTLPTERRSDTVEDAVSASIAGSGRQIVVAGAGYAGLHVALRLTARLRDRPEVELTLVDRHDYHQVITELSRVAGGTRAAGAVRIPLQDMLATRVRFAIRAPGTCCPRWRRWRWKRATLRRRVPRSDARHRGRRLADRCDRRQEGTDGRWRVLPGMRRSPSGYGDTLGVARCMRQKRVLRGSALAMHKHPKAELLCLLGCDRDRQRREELLITERRASDRNR